MKKLVKLSSLVLVLAIAIVALSACGGNGGNATELDLSHVDVITYSGDVPSAKLTGTAVGGNKVSMVDGRLRVDVAADVDDIEFDLAKFFTQAKYSKFRGANFNFTRSDVAIPGGTGLLVKGNAWVETAAGSAADRLYKPAGFENDATVTARTKAQISALENGDARMYILTKNLTQDKYLVYIDAATTSHLATGLTAVDFVFNGDNGMTSTLKVTVYKAAPTL